MIERIVYAAPAKIILLGEHAVVYGQPAIAIPFPALTAHAEPVAAPAGSGLTIIARDVHRAFHVHLEDETPDNALVFAAQVILKHMGRPLPDLTVEVYSTIPIGGGFGSGAAVSAALMRAIIGALGADLSEDQLNALVYEVEKVHHGTPSGIDNTVIVTNRPVYFVRGQPIETFTIGKPLPLVVAYSGKSTPTRETVGDVRKLYESDPATYGPRIEQIGTIVREARTVIEQGDLPRLGQLMRDDHDLLCELSVSSPALDRLVEAAVEAGAYGAKLSGGGRGGNMIALAAPDQVQEVSRAVRNAGAEKIWSVIVR